MNYSLFRLQILPPYIFQYYRNQGKAAESTKGLAKVGVDAAKAVLKSERTFNKPLLIPLSASIRMLVAHSVIPVICDLRFFKSSFPHLWHRLELLRWQEPQLIPLMPNLAYIHLPKYLHRLADNVSSPFSDTGYLRFKIL